MTASPELSAAGSRRPWVWTKWALRLCGIHSLVWGLFIILFPDRSCLVYGFDRPLQEIFLWRGVGLLIFLLGTGYLIASRDPLRHWSVVLVGLLAKFFGSLGMAGSALQGEVPIGVLWLLPVNDVIWWWPMALVCYRGIKADLNNDQFEFSQTETP